MERVATAVLDQALGRRTFSFLLGRKSEVHILNGRTSHLFLMSL